MGLFSKKHAPTVESTPAAAADAPVCPHATLAPRWDSAADLGIEGKISGYRCDGCQTVFSAEEGKALRAGEAERIKSTVFGA